MWGGLVIEYHTARVTVALGLTLAMVFAVGLKNRRRLIRQSTATCTYMQVDQACVILITGACLGLQTSTRAKGLWSHVTLLIVYSFSCDSFHCVLCKNSQFAIKRISHSKSDLQYLALKTEG